ncbi:MAG: MotA/TolQ/ExbB proton channel family protein [Deltaproteobacteria bacterium]|nr:MotA/TolQ/ExbB proton channel family protein [Deltaproteobacteria bacterium]MBT4640406.1 MotA/TolQ/ExbB proton channel family protein [Deltaproteobacteria bacterium]MBT6499701.1 MotA/TolQ/ExbB proton channel family protein [Deltaproteobacteria bacterium]MBT7152519.1 MotA/TolQ/ExbB proton channel family protein [Deltaproteobacteria bacterium]MBT7715103.1 MotA/TolQ/ExbB proton channel family protein [Deltaproteobacteria bacterium]
MNKRIITLCFLICLTLCQIPIPASAEDMRVVGQHTRSKKAALLKQVQTEKSEAETEALLTSRQIGRDRRALILDIQKLEKDNRTIRASNERQRIELKQLQVEKEKLLTRAEKISAVSRELIGFIRVNVRDLDALMNRSLQSAFIDDRGLFLTGLLNSNIYPDMKDIRRMVDLLLEEIRLSGEVRIQEQTIVGRSGEAEMASVLVLGNFTAGYRTAAETGIALYSEKSRRLFALSKLPSRSVQNKIGRYMDGETAVVPIDISRGSAIRQISGDLDLFEQITAGGPVVWPILSILLFGILIIAERLIFLLRRHVNAEKLVEQLNSLALRNQWESCENLLKKFSHKPLAIVLQAALKNRRLKREDIENVLQETILGQIPPLERFLSTLGMMASIAPLLGLLGTVTGMINTFHTITYFGTGDAKMMSGGISEALVTTMLGLSVAIPIMFSHTLLSRFVENLIAQMEEKAVAFINTIEKTRGENDPAA